MKDSFLNGGNILPSLSPRVRNALCVLLIMARSIVAFASAEELPRLAIKGKEILAPDGTTIRLRGFNHLWWTKPTAQDVVDVQALGANCARYMFGYQPKGTFDPGQLKFLDEHIRLFTKQKLWVILTLHQFEQKDGNAIKVPFTDAQLQKEYLDLWTYVVERYKDEPYIGAWEPMNEPHNVKEDVLRTWYVATIKQLRALDPRTPIVVEGANYSYPKDLADYLKIDDPALIYSFHMYVPHPYTHQKTEKPIMYPSEKVSRDVLAKAMEPAFEFGQKFNVPVYCGEFGVVTRAPGYDQWLKDTTDILEASGAHWTCWAWVKNEKVPINETFDCNRQKTGIYETMKTIFGNVRR